jgi:hypothetical protein
MRYSAIVHLIIVFLGIQSLYYGYTYIIGNIYAVALLLVNDFSSFSLFSGAPLYFFTGLISLFIGWLLLIKSVSVTSYIVTKSKFESQVVLTSNAKVLLSIFIVFLGLSSLLDVLPVFISSLWKAFKENAGSAGEFGSTEVATDWVTLLLRVIFPCLVIVFCPMLTDYFGRNIHLDEEIAMKENTSFAHQPELAIDAGSQSAQQDDPAAN